MSDKPIDPELSDFASSLRTLAPTAAAISRDELMFRAGQAAANSRRGPTLLAGFGGLAAGLVLGAAILAASWPRMETAGVHMPDRTASSIEQPARHEAPQPSLPPTANEPAGQQPLAVPPSLASTKPSVSPGRTNYLRTRNEVIRWGAESLPLRVGHAVPDRSAELDEFLELPPGTLEPRGRQGGSVF